MSTPQERVTGRPSAALTAVALAAALCASPGGAHPAPPRARPPASAVNIWLSDIVAGRGGFVIDGDAADQTAGFSIAGVGDVNGDGLDDLLIGAPSATVAGHEPAGTSYVVFGKRGTQAVDLAAIDAGAGGGFAIHGEGINFRSGASVAAAGDVNGDGLADLVIGVGTRHDGHGFTDRSYVVFGKKGASPVELAAIAAGGEGAGGFSIHADDTAKAIGFNVGTVGDFDGDGLADVLVDVQYQRTDTNNAGRSYVIFGKRGTAAVKLSAVAQGQGGVVINAEPGGHSDTVVAGAGDVNGDGMADLVIGMPNRNQSYVVFGRPGTAPIDLGAISAGDGGFSMKGYGYDAAGSSVAAAGDINGDGLADVLIGAPGSYWKVEGRGRTYVVFGRKGTDPVTLRELDAERGGYIIRGEGIRYDYSGRSVAGVGDINGDGLADILIGAPGADAERGQYDSAGRAYLVLGKPDTLPVELTAVTDGTSAGITIHGECGYGLLGLSVSGAGDVNGDGLLDLVVAAPWCGLAGARNVGRSYVIFGSINGAFSPSDFDQVGGRGNEKLIGTPADDGLAGGAGNDTLVGTGGADVLAGGPGDDMLVVDASLARALRGQLGHHGNTDRLSRLDGGAGFDTLKLRGRDITLDLRGIASQGAGLPGSRSRIVSIERIDLTGSGDNALAFGLADVQDMSAMNLINAGNQAALGWQNGSYRVPATVRRHQVVVDGDAGDRVFADPARWRNAGTVSREGQVYNVLNSRTGRVQLLLNQQVKLAGDEGADAGKR
ncbi:MAG: FG-GAP-like repeat-containing protein [Burkholderiaceae bacterium]